MWNILAYRMRGGKSESDILKISDNEYYDGAKRRLIEKGCEIVVEVRDLPYERLGEVEEGVRKALREQEEEGRRKLEVAASEHTG